MSRAFGFTVNEMVLEAHHENHPGLLTVRVQDVLSRVVTLGDA